MGRRAVDRARDRELSDEDPEVGRYDWAYLVANRNEWCERYGNQPGRPDPDYRREFNE